MHVAQAHTFEDQVRQVARLLWKDAFFDGASIDDGKERDGKFETKDTIHIVEATVSRQRDKARSDGLKTVKTVQKLRQSGPKAVQGWLVTKEEPTAEQREAVRAYSHSLKILSFDTFRSLLFDGQEYLRCRDKYRFGSILDYKTNSTSLPESEYIEIDFTDESRSTIVSYKKIIDNIETNGGRFAIIGEYGSGKSMSLRAVYARLRDLYKQHLHQRCPIYLNLRDHTGQQSPVEALERHARQIGYSSPAMDLVRAWRGGYVDLILDGFDEMATAGWGGSLPKVRAHREVGMTLVRKFIQESPAEALVLIAGRENFFDSTKEMYSALGMKSKFALLVTSEFNDQQLKEFLKRKKFRGTVPNWLPLRPLLIAYVMAENLVDPNSTAKLSPAEGWDKLLDMISQREAEQDARLDSATVRNVLERLATYARRTADGLGRLDILLIQNVFREIAGFPPDEAAQQFILRLPGLAPSAAEDSSRSFVDKTIADASRSGDMNRYLDHPYGSFEYLDGLYAPCGDLAKEMIAEHSFKNRQQIGAITRAIELAVEKDRGQIAMDLFGAAVKLDNLSFDSAIVIRNSIADNLDIPEASGNLSNITFRDCIVTNLSIDDSIVPANAPIFNECIVENLSSIFTDHDRNIVFRNTEISNISRGMSTNAAVFAASLPEPLKVLVSVLRKLFLQPGAGRREAAFLRGAIGAKERSLVPEVLSLVLRHEFAEPTRMHGKDVWLPNRRQTSRARSIIASPLGSNDPLTLDVLGI